MRTIQKYILQHQEDICRVSARDSGKVRMSCAYVLAPPFCAPRTLHHPNTQHLQAMVDAAFGEIMVTCEKISWLLSEGERWLLPERRSAGKMMFYKVPLPVNGQAC